MEHYIPTVIETETELWMLEAQKLRQLTDGDMIVLTALPIVRVVSVVDTQGTGTYRTGLSIVEGWTRFREQH